MARSKKRERKSVGIKGKRRLKNEQSLTSNLLVISVKKKHPQKNLKKNKKSAYFVLTRCATTGQVGLDKGRVDGGETGVCRWQGAVAPEQASSRSQEVMSPNHS